MCRCPLFKVHENWGGLQEVELNGFGGGLIIVCPKSGFKCISSAGVVRFTAAGGSVKCRKHVASMMNRIKYQSKFTTHAQIGHVDEV